VSGGKDIMKFGDKMEGHSRAYQAVSVSTGRCTFSRQFVAPTHRSRHWSDSVSSLRYFCRAGDALGRLTLDPEQPSPTCPRCDATSLQLPLR
jgi:hypothetical protein